MSLSFALTEDQRQQIKAALAGLTGQERQRERMRLRSRLLREDPEYRKKDNAKKAAHGRVKYHANLEDSRRKTAEKSRRYRAKARAEACAPDGRTSGMSAFKRSHRSILPKHVVDCPTFEITGPAVDVDERSERETLSGSRACYPFVLGLIGSNIMRGIQS